MNAARKIADQIYAIDSATAERSYTVNLSGPIATCDCPHYVYRCAGTENHCKHVAMVIEQQPFIERLETARGCTDTQIANLLPKYVDDPVVSGALRVARAERRLPRAERREDRRLREAFA